MTRLGEANVVAYLRRRGVLDAAAESPRVRRLAGGVSGTTLLVEAGGRRYVVKQPLPYLSVADEWPARVERAGAEASALRVGAELTPGRVPDLFDGDADEHMVTMAAAPDGWVDWRAELLTAHVDETVGAILGTVLGTWHHASRQDGPAGHVVRRELVGLDGFLELRGDPYHRTVAARRPDLAGPVEACLTELLTDPVCLVHGDFSPKNVLVGPAEADERGVWVLDFEVAHVGNPVFDVAFLLHHLVMKAVHLPAARARLEHCAAAFLDAYEAAGGPATEEATVVRHTGALLLARVHGKSPAAYLGPEQAAAVGELGATAVHGTIDLAGLWRKRG